MKRKQPLDCTIMVRVSKRMRDTLKNAAEKAGLSTAALIRHAALEKAKEILHYKVVFMVATLFAAAAAPAFYRQAAPAYQHASENDALALALTDVMTIHADLRCHIRYIWIASGEFEDLQAVSYAVNLVSRGSIGKRPVPVTNGKVLLARIDLRDYAPRDEDYREWAAAFEEMRFDPRFSLLLTKDTLQFAGALVAGKIPTRKKTVTKVLKQNKLVTVPPFVHTDGKTYTQRWEDETVTEVVTVTGLDNGDVLRLVGEHIDPRLMAALVHETQSEAPVVNHEYFVFRALSSIQDDGVFKTIWSGLYYELVGIKESKQKGITDEDLFLFRLGVGSATSAGNAAQRAFEENRPENRVAVFRSGVTGRPRRADAIPTRASRPSDGQAVVIVTRDVKQKQIDIARDAMLNLLSFVDDAREVIATNQFGLHTFALFDGNGKLQREVPPDVANDSTVPSPHPQRLQPAIGCIRCHRSDDGWRTLTNDVMSLVKGYKGRGVDILGDISGKGTQADVVNRLAGLYAGDLELAALPAARDNYARAILKVTGPWKASKTQLDVVKLAGERIGAIYNKWYELADARRACKDLGIPFKNRNHAAEQLSKYLPPVGPAEDARIAALWTPSVEGINASQYWLVFSFMAKRVQVARASLPPEPQQEQLKTKPEETLTTQPKVLK
jgi:hypothetical protein